MTEEEKDPAAAMEGKAAAMEEDEVPLVGEAAIDAKAEVTVGEEAVTAAAEAVEKDTDGVGVTLSAIEVQLQSKWIKRSMLR